MKLTWLGQAGYFIVTEQNLRIMIDPYLSNNLEMVKGESFHREVPMKEEAFQLEPDVLILTHIHDDHTDFATLDRILSESKKPMSVLAPLNTWQEVRRRYGGIHEYIQFDEGIEVTLEGVRFCSMYAAHSDERAVGVLIQADCKQIYHTGDTLFHRRLGEYIEGKVDAMLLPINGKGNNMNIADALRLTRKIKPLKVFPMHWDMFKAYGCDPMPFEIELKKSLQDTEVILPEEYCEIEL